MLLNCYSILAMEHKLDWPIEWALTRQREREKDGHSKEENIQRYEIQSQTCALHLIHSVCLLDLTVSLLIVDEYQDDDRFPHLPTTVL